MKCLLKCILVIPLSIISFLILILSLPIGLILSIPKFAGCGDFDGLDFIEDFVCNFWNWFRWL